MLFDTPRALVRRGFTRSNYHKLAVELSQFGHEVSQSGHELSQIVFEIPQFGFAVLNDVYIKSKHFFIHPCPKCDTSEVASCCIGRCSSSFSMPGIRWAREMCGRSAGGGRAVVNGAACGVSALAGFHPYRGVSGGFAPIAPSKGDKSFGDFPLKNSGLAVTSVSTNRVLSLRVRPPACSMRF